MSESPSDVTERAAQTKPAVIGVEYIPTDEEKKVFKECDKESFWYRSVPFSVSAMALTHILVAKGKLSASVRFGSLPKVLFAGMCGYFAGKFSYMKTCQQKFYKLENSPIAEALRQRQRHHHQQQQQQPSPQFSGLRLEPSDEEKSQYEIFNSERVPELPISPPDSTYSPPTHSPDPDKINPSALRDEEQDEEEKVKRKAVFYEHLRNKNRENYDITRSQKIDRDTPKKEVKKNKYGDTWED